MHHPILLPGRLRRYHELFLHHSIVTHASPACSALGPSELAVAHAPLPPELTAGCYLTSRVMAASLHIWARLWLQVERPSALFRFRVFFGLYCKLPRPWLRSGQCCNYPYQDSYLTVFISCSCICSLNTFANHCFYTSSPLSLITPHLTGCLIFSNNWRQVAAQDHNRPGSLCRAIARGRAILTVYGQVGRKRSNMHQILGNWGSASRSTMLTGKAHSWLLLRAFTTLFKLKSRKTYHI